MVRPGVACEFPAAAIATPHYLASATGLAVLATGGNALDAAVAANLTLGVVAPYLCGYGGDLFAIVWDGERAHGYLGSGRSPAAATIEALRHRLDDPAAGMPVLGPHSVTVPGAVAGWFDLLERFGTRPFAELAADARRLAAEGFPLTPDGARAITDHGPLYADRPTWAACYGSARPGATLHQPGLARLLDRLGADGPDAYYRGPVAEAIVAAVGEAGGLLTTADLAAHAGEWAEPLRVGFRDRTILELPPPTQGVAAAVAFGVLDRVGYTAPGTVERVHTLVEVAKAALVVRDRHVSDPAWMPEPAAALLDDRRLDTLAAGLPGERAAPWPRRPAADGGTAYLAAADRDGMLVSLIQSNFLGFGSGIHVPAWGVNLNNRGSSFRLDPAHPNALVGGKRPLHTLIPALVLRDGRAETAFGTMGGHAQLPVQLQVATALVDDGADPQAAVAAPRFRVEVGDGRVCLERRAPPELVEGLRARGHRVEVTRSYDPGMGHAHVVTGWPGRWRVGVDPRCEGGALGC